MLAAVAIGLAGWLFANLLGHDGIHPDVASAIKAFAALMALSLVAMVLDRRAARGSHFRLYELPSSPRSCARARSAGRTRSTQSCPRSPPSGSALAGALEALGTAVSAGVRRLGPREPAELAVRYELGPVFCGSSPGP